MLAFESQGSCNRRGSGTPVKSPEAPETSSLAKALLHRRNQMRRAIASPSLMRQAQAASPIRRREQKESGAAPDGYACIAGSAQAPVGFAGFFVFGFFFFATAGLMPKGLPAGRAVASLPSGRKKRRHSGESCERFWTMQAVIRSTSGM
jgi:hypothetical protein